MKTDGDAWTKIVKHCGRVADRQNKTVTLEAAEGVLRATTRGALAGASLSFGSDGDMGRVTIPIVRITERPGPLSISRHRSGVVLEQGGAKTLLRDVPFHHSRVDIPERGINISHPGLSSAFRDVASSADSLNPSFNVVTLWVEDGSLAVVATDQRALVCRWLRGAACDDPDASVGLQPRGCGRYPSERVIIRDGGAFFVHEDGYYWEKTVKSLERVMRPFVASVEDGADWAECHDLQGWRDALKDISGHVDTSTVDGDGVAFIADEEGARLRADGEMGSMLRPVQLDKIISGGNNCLAGVLDSACRGLTEPFRVAFRSSPSRQLALRSEDYLAIIMHRQKI